MICLQFLKKTGTKVKKRRKKEKKEDGRRRETEKVRRAPRNNATRYHSGLRSKSELIESPFHRDKDFNRVFLAACSAQTMCILF